MLKETLLMKTPKYALDAKNKHIWTLTLTDKGFIAENDKFGSAVYSDRNDFSRPEPWPNFIWLYNKNINIIKLLYT